MADVVGWLVSAGFVSYCWYKLADAEGCALLVIDICGCAEWGYVPKALFEKASNRPKS